LRVCYTGEMLLSFAPNRVTEEGADALTRKNEIVRRVRRMKPWWSWIAELEAEKLLLSLVMIVLACAISFRVDEVFEIHKVAGNTLWLGVAFVLYAVLHIFIWLLEDDNPRFLRQALVGRVRKILTVMILAEDIDEFIADAPSGWRVHRLSGDRQNEWSVSVSGNWRITFEEEDAYIDRLNLEDYH